MILFNSYKLKRTRSHFINQIDNTIAITNYFK